MPKCGSIEMKRWISLGRLIQLQGTELLNAAIPGSYGRLLMDTATETPLAGTTEVWQNTQI